MRNTIKQLDCGRWVVVNWFGDILSVPTWDVEEAKRTRDAWNEEKK